MCLFAFNLHRVDQVSIPQSGLYNCVNIFGIVGRSFEVRGWAMMRKYTSKTGAWLEEKEARTKKRSNGKEGVRVVKVMFPLEEEMEAVELRPNDIADSFPNAIWPGSYYKYIYLKSNTMSLSEPNVIAHLMVLVSFL